MPAFTADDETVQATAAVLEGGRPDGTHRPRCVGPDDVTDDGETEPGRRALDRP